MTTQLPLFQPPQSKTRESLANDIWRACDILSRDNNCGGVMEYVEHLAWLLFLRFLDAQEEEWAAEAALSGEPYERILDGDLRWSAWARHDWKAKELLPFIHGRLIPHLQGLSGSPVRETISSIFSERNVDTTPTCDHPRAKEVVNGGGIGTSVVQKSVPDSSLMVPRY